MDGHKKGDDREKTGMEEAGNHKEGRVGMKTGREVEIADGGRKKLSSSSPCSSSPSLLNYSGPLLQHA